MRFQRLFGERLGHKQDVGIHGDEDLPLGPPSLVVDAFNN